MFSGKGYIVMKLHELKNTSRQPKKKQRVGRGTGSHRGKTCKRGQKGEGSRSGARMRYGKEGGQFPLHMKLPIRGFTRGKFVKPCICINLGVIDKLYNDGEVVSLMTLIEKRYTSFNRAYGGVKVLAKGELTKKVTLEVDAISEAAKKFLDDKKITYKLLKQND